MGGWWEIYSAYNFVPSGYSPSQVSPNMGFIGLTNDKFW